MIIRRIKISVRGSILNLLDGKSRKPATRLAGLEKVWVHYKIRENLQSSLGLNNHLYFRRRKYLLSDREAIGGTQFIHCLFSMEAPSAQASQYIPSIRKSTLLYS